MTGAIRPSYGNVVLANPTPDADGPGLLDDWIDYGLAGAPITLYWGEVGANFPDDYTVVYRAFCHSFWADADVITIRQRDALQLLDQPVVTDGFSGTGGIEGGGAVAKRKQFVAGDPGFIEPILVDVNKQVYFVQSTATGGLESTYIPNGAYVETSPFDVYDNGVEITRSTTAYATSTAMLAEAPAAGQVKYWYGPASAFPLSASGGFNGPVYFRLGSPPAGDLRVFAAGYPKDEDHQRLGTTWGSWNAAHMALRAGVPRANVSTEQAQLNVYANLVDDDSTYLDLLADQALAVQGWFGFDRLGVFRSGWLQDPVETDPVPTSVHTFTEGGIGDLRREPVAGMEVPVWSVALTAGDTWPSQLAGSASATIRDYLTRKVWSSVSGISAATKLRDPGAEHQTVNIRCRLLQNSFGTRLWFERYFHLYGGARHFFAFDAPMSEELLALDLHDVVTLTHRRFGLSAGKKFRIASLTIDCAASVPKIRFVLWGGTPGVYGGVISTTPNASPFIDPTVARNSIGMFTGTMVGSVSVESSTSITANDQTSIGEFTGLMIAVALPIPDIKALLHFNGTHGDTTTVDSSVTTKTVTIIGSATLSTTWAKFGSASLAVPNTGASTQNGATIADHADFDFGTGDFTIECHFRRNSNTRAGILFTVPLGTLSNLRVSVSTAGNLLVEWKTGTYPGGAVNTDVNVALDTPTWVEFVRRSGTMELWVDGFEVYAETLPSGAAEVASVSGTIYVGCDNVAGTSSLDGYIDEFTITKGIARPVFADIAFDSSDANWSSVTFLTNGSGTTDESSHGNTTAITGTTAVSTAEGGWAGHAFIQGAVSSYLKATLGGDGSMTGDFTIEVSAGVGGNNVIFMAESAGYLYGGSFQSYGGTSLSVATNLNSFNRRMYAISRVGSSIKVFINGKLSDTQTYSGTVNLQTLRFGMYVPNNNLHWTGGYGQIRVTKGVGRYTANYTIRPVPTVEYDPYD